jgi:hypothetical protein
VDAKEKENSLEKRRKGIKKSEKIKIGDKKPSVAFREKKEEGIQESFS